MCRAFPDNIDHFYSFVGASSWHSRQSTSLPGAVSSCSRSSMKVWQSIHEKSAWSSTKKPPAGLCTWGRSGLLGGARSASSWQSRQVALSLRSSAYAGAPKPKVSAEIKTVAVTDVNTFLIEIITYPFLHRCRTGTE